MEALVLATEIAKFIGVLVSGKRNDTLDKLVADASGSLERVLAIAQREREGGVTEGDLKSLQAERHAAEQRRREAVDAAVKDSE